MERWGEKEYFWRRPDQKHGAGDAYSDLWRLNKKQSLAGWKGGLEFVWEKKGGRKDVKSPAVKGNNLYAHFTKEKKAGRIRRKEATRKMGS